MASHGYHVVCGEQDGDQLRAKVTAKHVATLFILPSHVWRLLVWKILQTKTENSM